MKVKRFTDHRGMQDSFAGCESWSNTYDDPETCPVFVEVKGLLLIADPCGCTAYYCEDPTDEARTFSSPFDSQKVATTFLELLGKRLKQTRKKYRYEVFTEFGFRE